MDVVFQEEKEHLDKTEKTIDSVASSFEREITRMHKRISEFVCVDYNDRQELAILRKNVLDKQTEADELRGYQDSPYFGRMDLESEDGEVSDAFYIGKTAININHDLLVLDWRSPVGQYFYMKTERRFHVNSMDYNLLLRRALEVQNGRLISYNTEFDGETVSLEGEVIDPFLLTVLKDKRRQNRLTDIIKTIQENQNNIIRQPRAESFIVQGCAGSGKTMILLHRLSFLVFNNKEMALSRIRIITPNKSFDGHIDELSTELGLGQIERNSVEELYVSLIKHFSKKMDVSASVASEKALDSALLAELYSENYFNNAIDHYHRYWEETIGKIFGLPIKELADKLGVALPIIEEHSIKAYSLLEGTLRNVKTKLLSNLETQASIVDQIHNVQEEYEQSITWEDEESKKLTVTKEIAKARLQDALENDSRLTTEIKTGITTAKSSVESSQSLVSQLSETVDGLSDQIASLQKESGNLTDYNHIKNRTDNLSLAVLSALTDTVNLIENLEEGLKNTPIYGFARRNRIRNQLSNAYASFKQNSPKIIQEYIARVRSQRRSYQSDLDSAQAEMEKAKKDIENGQMTLSRLRKEIRVLEECLSYFTETEYPDAQVMMQSVKDVPEAVKAYSTQYQNHKLSIRRKQSCESRLLRLQQTHKEILRLGLVNTDAEDVDKAINLVKQLRISEISRNVMFRDMVAVYRRFNEPYRKDNYRHKLYIKLLYCYLYFPAERPELFLNIDEAQDISISEYRLLKSVLNEHSIFNLYGDVNQLVYDYKGISRWDSISGLIAQNVFTLNENYRNTLQITNYCNKEFDTEVFPIGISGDDVRELQLKDAVKWLIEQKENNPNFRVAIIFRYGVIDIEKILSELLQDEDVSWYIADDNKISVVSVEGAKGLEFDAVVALVDRMTDNEKYISYTRALDRLVVVRDKFEAEFSQEILDSGNEIDENELLSDDDQMVEDTGTNTVPDNPTTDQSQKSDKINEGDYQTTLITQDVQSFLNEVGKYIKDAFGEGEELNKAQQDVVTRLYQKKNIACNAPSGWKKSLILYLAAKYMHEHTGLQTIITAESHLQENELVLAEKLGLKAGSITESMNAFKADFKREKYDVIFVSFDFFAFKSNVDDFAAYFNDKLFCWGIDHPSEEILLWGTLEQTTQRMQCTSYLMSKTGFEGIDVTGYELINIEPDIESLDNELHKITFLSEEDKDAWLISNILKLWGQGIIYCDSEERCKYISKILRKKKLKAEAYIGILNPSNLERINYLSNSFSKGGLPILVTCHDIGKNISNPNIRFIVHYDVPKDKTLYQLHVMQIGQLASDPAIYDLIV